MKWMRRIVWGCAAWLSFSVQASVTHLLPVPKNVVAEQRKKTIQLHNRLVREKLSSPCIVHAFHNLLGQKLTMEGKGLWLEIKAGYEIPEVYDYVLADYLNEVYPLIVGEKSIQIEVTTETGGIRAVRTLIQMAEGTKYQKSLEACTSVDWPTFKLYVWMHDVANENFMAWPPALIVLQEEWNKVHLSLPYIPADGIRLNKWMVTFVLTDLSSPDALDGLIYSPDKEKTNIANYDKEKPNRLWRADAECRCIVYV